MEMLGSYSTYEQLSDYEIQNKYKPGIETNIRIHTEDLEKIQFSPVEEKFKPAGAKVEKGTEVLWNNETQTLVVPTPPDSDDLTAGDLAKMAVPVAGFIKKTQPDIVVGCDRGGRLYSLAVYNLWRERNPKKRFPTLDSKLHFARLSTSVDEDVIDQSIERIIKQSLRQAKMKGKARNGESPRILFIDDWINSGATREHILSSLERLGVKDNVDINFAVMCGGKADVSGSDLDKGVPWQDDPRIIGVEYPSGSPVASPVYTKQAREIRKSIHKETKKVAAEFRKQRAIKNVGKLIGAKR